MGYVPHRGNPRSQSRSRHAPAHAFTCALSAICLVPTAPAAPQLARLQNKGEEKPQADPSLPTKPPFVQVPEERCVRGEGEGCTRTALSRKRYNSLFQALPGKISFAGSPFNFTYIYIFFFQGYFGSSCCRREERGRSRRFDLFLLRQNFAGEGPTRHGERDSTHARQRQCPRPPAPASRGAEPGRSLDFRGKKKLRSIKMLHAPGKNNPSDRNSHPLSEIAFLIEIASNPGRLRSWTLLLFIFFFIAFQPEHPKAKGG